MSPYRTGHRQAWAVAQIFVNDAHLLCFSLCPGELNVVV